MRENAKILLLLSLALNFIGCSKGSTPPRPANPPTPAANAAPGSVNAPVTNTTESLPGSRAVKTEMRNVNFHLMDQAVAHIETLSGELLPSGKYEMPVFDDKASFEVRVADGTISISPQALTSIMNNYVFAKKDSPLKDLQVSIEKDQLIIKGKLASKGVPFETAGTLSATSDGRLRVRTEKVKALHVSVKGMMGLFGIDLASLVNTSKIDGMDTDKNDLLMDLGKLLPPPHIQGKVVDVKIENNSIITIFGDGGKAVRASEEQGNYMSFQGNRVQFGKMVMESTDLVVFDLDPGDPLDWNQSRYKDQLVAGYSKITPNFGLRAYVKDFSKLPRSSAALAAQAAVTNPPKN
ncbi:MAG TPA: hypothetical protein VGH37_08820 [Candidatus Acidoferrum sp.]